MKAKVMFLMSLICFMPLLGCDEETNLESKVFEYFIAELINEEEYFDNSFLKIEKKLFESIQEDLHTYMPCEKEGALLHLESNQIEFIDDVGDIAASKLFFKKELLPKGETQLIKVRVFRVKQNKKGNYIVKIECTKSLKKGIQSTRTYIIFSDKEGNIINWCNSNLVERI